MRNTASAPISDLRFANGYVFENGTRFYETLGKERAEELVRTLQKQGYKITNTNESNTAGRRAA